MKIAYQFNESKDDSKKEVKKGVKKNDFTKDRIHPIDTPEFNTSTGWPEGGIDKGVARIPNDSPSFEGSYWFHSQNFNDEETNKRPLHPEKDYYNPQDIHTGDDYVEIRGVHHPTEKVSHETNCNADSENYNEEGKMDIENKNAGHLMGQSKKNPELKTYNASTRKNADIFTVKEESKHIYKENQNTMKSSMQEQLDRIKQMILFEDGMTYEDVKLLTEQEKGGDSGGKGATGKDAGGDAGKDAGGDAGKDAGGDAGKDAGGDAGKDAGGDAGKDAGKDAGGDDSTKEKGDDAESEKGDDAESEKGDDSGPDTSMTEVEIGGITYQLDTSSVNHTFENPTLSENSKGQTILTAKVTADDKFPTPAKLVGHLDNDIFYMEYVGDKDGKIHSTFTIGVKDKFPTPGSDDSKSSKSSKSSKGSKEGSKGSPRQAYDAGSYSAGFDVTTSSNPFASKGGASSKYNPFGGGGKGKGSMKDLGDGELQALIAQLEDQLKGGKKEDKKKDELSESRNPRKKSISKKSKRNVIKLTESDLYKIVDRVLNENKKGKGCAESQGGSGCVKKGSYTDKSGKKYPWHILNNKKGGIWRGCTSRNDCDEILDAYHANS